MIPIRVVPITQTPAEDAWREIEQLLDELGTLSRQDLEPAAFEQGFLQRVVTALAAEGAVLWRIMGDSAQIIAQTGISAARLAELQQSPAHCSLVSQGARSKEPLAVAPHSSIAATNNTTDWLILLGPVMILDRPEYLLEIFQRPEPRPSLQQSYLQILQTACAAAEVYYRRRALGDLSRVNAELSGRLDFARQIQAAFDLDAAAYCIVNESRRLLEADRVSLLKYDRKHSKLLGMSGVERFDRCASLIARLEDLASAVAASGEDLWLPEKEPQSGELPPQIEQPLHRFLDESHSRHLGVLLLRSTQPETFTPEEAGPQQLLGALVIERFSGDSRDEDEWRQQTEALASLSAERLATALAHDRLPFRKSLTALSHNSLFRRIATWPRLAIGLAITLVAAAVLCFIPAELKIAAEGELQPVKRVHIFAPASGVVVRVPIQPQAQVKPGDLLVELESPMLNFQFSEVVGKRRTAHEDLRAAETALLDGDTSSETMDRGLLAARVSELKELVRSLDQQHAILSQQIKELSVRSPQSGEVITWDLGRRLQSRPVERGAILLTLADLKGAWEIQLFVPAEQIGHVLRATQGDQTEPPTVTFEVGTAPGKKFITHVQRLDQLTENHQGDEPSVRLLATAEGLPTESLRPGATVKAHIHCGQKSLGYVWFHSLLDTVRARVFF